jgi:hypothetical protein
VDIAVPGDHNGVHADGVAHRGSPQPRHARGRYAAFESQAQLDALALWVAHTWFFDDPQVEATPYLSVTSVEPESGKSLLLEALGLLVCRP